MRLDLIDQNVLFQHPDDIGRLSDAYDPLILTADQRADLLATPNVITWIKPAVIESLEKHGIGMPDMSPDT